MKRSTFILFMEFLLLFVLFPWILTLRFSILLKVILGVLGFLYMLFILIKRNNHTFFKWKQLPEFKIHFRRILFLFIGLLVFSTAYIYHSFPEKLFSMPLQKTGIWIVILLIYSFLSVIPQEIIYRSFFFIRYQKLFKNETVLIFINAVVFSLGHLFFQNLLVLGITFVGGLFFGYSYHTTRSLVFVSIEHSLYGCWLFTVGMGDLLGFPVP